MCMRSFEVCSCDCHEMTKMGMRMYHIGPCCNQCPHCKGNITFFYYDKHVEECKSKTEDLLRVLEKNANDYVERVLRDKDDARQNGERVRDGAQREEGNPSTGS